MCEMHTTQGPRYESGETQPTLDALKRLALGLSVSTDLLVFDKDERGPDEDLRLQFEAMSKFTPEEKKIARAVIDGLILKHSANRFSQASREDSASRNQLNGQALASPRQKPLHF
jgi:transcriptional regulator with XRE-family HTH domain